MFHLVTYTFSKGGSSWYTNNITVFNKCNCVCYSYNTFIICFDITYDWNLAGWHFKSLTFCSKCKKTHRKQRHCISFTHLLILSCKLGCTKYHTIWPAASIWQHNCTSIESLTLELNMDNWLCILARTDKYIECH